MKRLFCVLALLLPLSLAGQPTAAVKSVWEGCERLDFQVEGRDAILVIPREAAPGRPWIWRPAFFGAFPSVDRALLEKGWHIAYYDVTHLYGSPRSVTLAKAFYDYVVPTFGLSRKTVVEGFSRGGYFAFAWADAWPETVSCLYVDAPVCDITSWPGRGSRQLWQDFLAEWGVKDEDVDSGFRGNALQHLPRLAEAHIPVIAVCGDADSVVPYGENMEKVASAYREMGGEVEVIVKPGCDHHPHSLEDPAPVVAFLERHAAGAVHDGAIRLRGSLDNALATMAVRKEATVAFFGGSITEMKGWKDMVKEDLRQRFPETAFHFIDAGIASLGSTPHAFRFEEDVLAKGTPDLLFVEAAVNDNTNGFSPQAQVRAMEGIVRHARAVNPEMDIVFLYFICEPFVTLLDDGEVPDVLFNHERVANHYHLNTIDLVSEVHTLMKQGAFDWKTFGGTHPSPFGHRIYADAIDRLLDLQAKPAAELVTGPHTSPSPLEEACYGNGRLLPPTAAVKTRGFRLEEDWVPSDGAGTRSQYVHVPTLVCEDGGTLTLRFDGTAVGLYCTCGPNAGVLTYTIDGKEYPPLDTFTLWSGGLHIPWLHMLADGLEEGPHLLKLRVHPPGNDKAGKDVPRRAGCYIRNFAVN